MSRLWAIALLTLRAAVRSRVVLTLLGLLLLTAVGLPLAVRGDGTLAGRVQILLSYTLGLGGFLVSLAAVWAGCAAIAAEVQERQIQLLVTKPVSALTLWLGKWLGLLLLSGGLLAFTGATVLGLLRWTTRPATLSAEDTRRLREEILVARAASRPAVPDVAAAARAEIDAGRRAGRYPAGADPANLFALVSQGLRQAEFVVAPGARREWTVPLPRALPADRPVFLQFRFAKSQMDMEPVAGRWTAAGPAGGTVECAGAWSPAALQTIALPPGAWTAGGRVTLAFENLDPSGASVAFDPRDGIELLAYRGGYTGNYLRALLVIWARCAFLAAVGLAAGAWFSMPVASFFSLAFLAIVRLGAVVRAAQEEAAQMLQPDPGPLGRALHEAALAVLRGVGWLTAPLQDPGTLDALAAGRWIPWGRVAAYWGWGVLVCGGLLALAGSGILRRRELGLPE